MEINMFASVAHTVFSTTEDNYLKLRRQSPSRGCRSLAGGSRLVGSDFPAVMCIVEINLIDIPCLPFKHSATPRPDPEL